MAVWQSDDDAPGAALDTQAHTFDLEPLAEAFVTADLSEGSFHLGTVALDPPVLVETEGDSGSGPGACLGGCSGTAGSAWQASAPEYAWAETEGSLSLFQLTFAHD